MSKNLFCIDVGVGIDPKNGILAISSFFYNGQSHSGTMQFNLKGIQFAMLTVCYILDCCTNALNISRFTGRDERDVNITVHSPMPRFFLTIIVQCLGIFHVIEPLAQWQVHQTHRGYQLRLWVRMLFSVSNYYYFL